MAQSIQVMAQSTPWMPPTRLLGMTDDELAAFEADITASCAEHSQNCGGDIDYRACVSLESKGSKYFIKFDDPERLWPEFSTQSYIYDYAKRHKNGPRIPQALHYFEGQGQAYLVMEYIEFTDEPTPDLVERTAKALNWLSEVLPPSEDVMGPVGGGLIRHRFFKDGTAPLEFSSVDALERYMNKGRGLLSKLDMYPAEPIIIINDPLIFTQSDMHVSNFGVDKCGNTMLFDFGQIGRLPLSFAKYAMQSYRDDSFIARVAKLLSWPDNSSPNSNMRSMGKVAGCLWRAADPKLGLEKDGLPRPRMVKARA